MRHTAPFATLVFALAAAARAAQPAYNSTFFGGPATEDTIAAVAYADGEVYVTGVTRGGGIPGVVGGAQEQPASPALEVFVARLDHDLSVVLQATYFGGKEDEFVTSIAVTTDAVYISGWTNSSDLPATAGGAQPGASKYSSVFVARLSRDLQEIERVSYLGGDSEDLGLAMAVSPQGIFVTGRTWSSDLANTGSAQTVNAGRFDAFVGRFNHDLTTVRATYVGGGGRDQGHAIAVSRDSVYLAGLTSSTDFPHAAGGAQEELMVPPGHSSMEDAFVAQLDLDLNTIQQSTFLGGSYNDHAEALAVSPEGSVYVLGDTASKDFPFTERGAQPLHTQPLDSYRQDAFVARLNSRLTECEATHLGGHGQEYAWAMLVDSQRVLVAGATTSDDFPATAGGLMPQARPGFVASLAPDLGSIGQAAYFGGNGSEWAWALASVRDPITEDIVELYLAGKTYSSVLPNTAGAAQPQSAGGWDGFVARMEADLRE